ncbi:hypothetical protein K431DRAFT_311494 [Polychaeton citri CBS 116435]|uniref:Uncharacterized protein n=1 Tax=Polychaeton citri CBS 116435 TaxID=1314669 RepID=A0A9P4US81_9PEZI|nr:hypothetical protein K431DRAFT_311494 [Polychaeton citri CBS 116435]
MTTMAALTFAGQRRTSYTPSLGCSASMGTSTEAPAMLVMQESIKSLMRQVTDLQDHCEGLEADNADLKHRIEVLESGQHGVGRQAQLPLAALTNSSGYQESEASTCGSPTPANTELELSRLSYRIEDMGEHLEKLSLHVSDLASQETPGEGIPQGIQTELKQLKVSSESLLNTRDLERMIDDAHTKPDLYQMYRDLTDGMRDAASPAAVRSRGAFHGNFNDMVALRNRVLFCITMFDGYRVALEEARNAEVV